MPPRDHPESRSLAESLARHEMFVCGFDDTQKIGVPGEHTAPTSLPLRSSNAHRRGTLSFQIALPKSAATRRAGCGRGFSPQTRVFCV